MEKYKFQRMQNIGEDTSKFPFYLLLSFNRSEWFILIDSLKLIKGKLQD